MKALKELKEHRARRGSDEEEEETEETILKPENGKGQQKVWSLRDSGDDFAMFSFKIGTSNKSKNRKEVFLSRQEAISRSFFSFCGSRFFSTKNLSLSFSRTYENNQKYQRTNERTN